MTQGDSIPSKQLVACGVSAGSLAFDVDTAQVYQESRMIGSRCRPDKITGSQ
jgi:hypothetical protein